MARKEMAPKEVSRSKTPRGSRARPSPASGLTTEQQIRSLAYEIYEQRRDTGMTGDSDSDWLEAERQLRDTPVRRTRSNASKT